MAGIINYYEDDIKVKNEIIRKSLSYEWIRKLEEEEKGLIKIAMEDYQNLNYFDSLSSFEKYLIDYEFSDGPNIPHYYYIMGHCAYKLQDFDKALKYFSLSDFDVEDESIWYFKLMHQKGLTYYYLGRIEECLECLKIIIDKGKKDTVYARALLNYGSITLQSDIETHKDNAERIFNEIVNGTAFKVEKIKEPVLQELKSISFFNLGQIYAFGNTNSLKAIEYFKNAVSFSPDSSKPRIILALLPLLSDAIEKKDYTTQLYELIDSGVITPKDEDPERPMDFNYDELRDYLLLVFLEYRESIFPLLKSHFRLLGEKTLAKHLFELAVFSINKNSDWDKAKIVFQYIRDCFDFAEMEIDADTRFSTLKLLAYISVVNDSYAIYVEYITSLRDKESKRIDFIDLEIFANFINQLTEEGKVEEAIESAELIESFRVFASDDMMLNYLVIYHLELNARVKINDFERVISLAEKIVQLAENETIKMLKSNLIGEVEVGIGLIRNNAQAILRQLTKLNPIKVEKGFGRNDLVKVRYKDGVTVLAKYKKIKDDIASGACIVLQ